MRCVNENRKQRKRLIGCFDDWLFRSTIPIGWRLRALRLNGNRFYAMFFACVILLRLLRFLRTFLTQSIAFCALRVLRLDGNRARHTDTHTETDADERLTHSWSM